MSDYRYLRCERLDDGRIVRIVLDRPGSRNAQNRGLLVELDEAFVRAERDDEVRVVILAGAGRTFSSGHDLGTSEQLAEMTPGPDQHPSYQVNGGTRLAAERRMLQEHHYFQENTKRWRNLRKVTIAEVQGEIFSAGLMLAWACDLIVAADDARFADPVGPRLGGSGVEYFAHPWEFGPRKAKELLLTGDAIDADEAYRLGMVSKVFPLAELPQRTLEFARRIAQVPTVASVVTKDVVNQTVDAQGFQTALANAFSIHQMLHAHWAELHGSDWPLATEEDGVPDWRTAPPVALAAKDAVGGEPSPA